MNDAISFVRSADWRALPPDKKIQRYFLTLEIQTGSKNKRLIHRLQREHPHEWHQFKEVMEQRSSGNQDNDIYSLKNTSMQFSLLAGAAVRGKLHAKFLRLVDEYYPNVSSVLDVGCENGLLTCFYALKWPEAKIVGIDPSSEAIVCARELANLLRLKNIEFIEGRAQDIQQILPNQLFDLIITVTVLHDAEIFPNSETIEVAPSQNFCSRPVLEEIASFQAIANALATPQSQWISAEVCLSSNMFWWWCRAMDHVGLGINWANSYRVACEDDLLTILVAAREFPRPIDSVIAQGFWISQEFNHGTRGKSSPWSFRDYVAQIIFDKINPKKRVEHLIGTDQTGVELLRVEVWTADPLALYFSTSHSGEVHLHIRAITDLVARRKHWDKVKESVCENAPVGAIIRINGSLYSE